MNTSRLTGTASSEDEGGMLAQRWMGWPLSAMEQSHLNSLTDMSNAFSCTQRKMTEAANEQLFKGDLRTAQRSRHGVVFLQGRDGEFTFMVKHGLLVEISVTPRISSWSSDKTFRRWTLTHQTSPSIMLSKFFAGMDGTKMDGSRSCFADDLFIKYAPPDHTAKSSKDVILDNATSIDTTLAEKRYKQNLDKLETVPRIRRYGEQGLLAKLVLFGQDPGWNQALLRPLGLQWHQHGGN